MKIFLISLLLVTVTIAQDESILSLFPGKWKMDVDESEVFEFWEIVSDTELFGSSYILENGEKYISENMYLKKFADQWAYVAIPEDQTMTLFVLVDYSSKKFVFENLEHDFPQRIIYEFHKDGKMTAAIEDSENSENKRMEFSFKIVND